VPELVRADRRYLSPNACVMNHAAHPHAGERAGRRAHSQEHPPELARAATLQIRDQRLADIDRQRQPVVPVALPAHEDLARPPVEILELYAATSPARNPSRTSNNKIA
jgi:hypothetical protein